MDLEFEIENIKQSEPFIAVTGKAGDENCQYFICAEQALTTESISLRDAFLDLICAYYVYNISYPKAISGVHLFFQELVFGIKSSQKLPLCLVKLLQNIKSTL